MSDNVLMIAGGVASLSSGLICLEISESQLQCVELSTGNVVSTIPGNNLRPLTWIQGKLIGWQPEIIDHCVVKPFVADVSSDVASVVALPALTLPDWVNVDSVDVERFFITATEEGLNAVFRWRARTEYEGGAPAPQDVLEACRHSATGTAVYNVETKELMSSEISDQNAKSTSEEGHASVLDPPQGTHRVPYRRGMKIQSDPWIVDGKAIALWPHDDGETQGLSLVSTQDAAVERATVTSQRLTRRSIDPAKDKIHISADGRQIFVGALKDEAEKDARWLVFDAHGKNVGSVPREPGTQDIVIAGNHLIYIVDVVATVERGNRRQRYLKVRDFASGQLLWTVQVFDRIDEPPLSPAPCAI